MRIILNYIIVKLGFKNIEIDNRIPTSYIVKELIIKKLVCCIRGLILFYRIKSLIFVENRVKIICKSKIKVGISLNIGYGSFINALSKNGILFGDRVSIGKFTTIECTGTINQIGEGLVVGNDVGLGSHGFWGCAGGIKVEDKTIFGNFVSLHSENHNFENIEIPIKEQGVNRQGIVIGSNCWIGSKVTILDGVTIEDGVIIAAGALLTKGTYKKNGIYGGVPAKLIKIRE